MANAASFGAVGVLIYDNVEDSKLKTIQVKDLLICYFLSSVHIYCYVFLTSKLEGGGQHPVVDMRRRMLKSRWHRLVTVQFSSRDAVLKPNS